jgi:subtilisin family serine protease
MRWESPTEGRSGVPLRFPRPVIPVIAIGMAAVWVAAGSAPAFADQVRTQEFWLGQLNVSQAWTASQGTGITVAVLSDGIDAQHADLGGIVTVGPDFTGTGSLPGPVGTQEASLIAGRGTGPRRRRAEGPHPVRPGHA